MSKIKSFAIKSPVFPRIDVDLKGLISLPRSNRNRMWQALLVMVATAGMWSVATISRAMQSPLYFNYIATGQQVGQPIKVNFSQEIKPGFNYWIEPGVLGSWQEERGLVGVTGLTFIPEKPLIPASVYQIHIGGMKRMITGRRLPDTVLSVKTEEPPAIAGYLPANNATGISPQGSFRLMLASQNRGLRRLVLASEPVAEWAPEASPDDKTFSWRPVGLLQQGSEYRVWVEDLNIEDPTQRRLMASEFTVVAEPQVAGVTAANYLYPGDKVGLKFSEPMDRSETSIWFDLPGTGGWVSDTVYEFKPTNLIPAREYSYGVHNGSRSQAGGVVVADHSFKISTPGKAYVTAVSPGGSGVNIRAQIRFSFDQPVDHASAESKFSISPAVSGKLTWSGQTLVFTPVAYAYQTLYTASMAAGVQSIHGLPSGQAFKAIFTTELQVIRLGVPAYKQQFALSCEASALRMVLAFRGISVSDADVLGRIGYNPRPRDTVGNSWDNPYQMFVGDVNGIQNSTGYGVYAPPIASAAVSFGRSAMAHTGVSANFVATKIHEGAPVIVWGWGSKANLDSWNTNSGMVEAWLGEHTRVVTGVVGRPDSPVGFYLNDPWTGASHYWTTQQLVSNLNVFGNLSNQAVVVY